MKLQQEAELQGQITTSNDTNELHNEVEYISTNASQQRDKCKVILPTAIVTVLGKNNAQFKCRALLDSGSQGSLISEACVLRVGLQRQYDKTRIFGIGNQHANQSKGKVNLKINTNHHGKVINTEALCLPKLTKIMPAFNIQNKQFEYFTNLTFADPNFYKASEIDIILGADVFVDCCLAGTIVHPSGSPSAINTIFGWVLMGRAQSETVNYVCSNYTNFDDDHCLQRFWEIEEIPSTTHLSPEEEEAEKHFQQTTVRLADGRYEVKLPFKSDIPRLGESKTVAFKRLQAMERKFKQNKQMQESYTAFMHEYIQLGHMKVIDEACSQFKNFLPHHAVMKPNSLTSKIRVVFDASCPTSNGMSLNDNLLVGPKVQRDLFEILISFRLNKIAFVSDIEKMYRQVSMNERDRFMQCILWRDNEQEKVRSYTLNTVTYGTAAASFLAIRSLKQITIDNTSLQANTAKAINNSFYVDDFMHASADIHQAIELKDDLNNALSQAGFHLRKWASNSSEFLNTIPLQDRADSFDTQIQNTSTVSTLGLIWNTQSDCFKFSCITTSDHQNTTKRTVLSDISKVFDPMGWMAPMIIGMKIFMQKLWLRGVNWDEHLTTDLFTEWQKIRTNIEGIPSIKINRWFNFNNGDQIELHGFSDASELAYAAAVYLKVNSKQHGTHTNLIAAKTRVSPVKQITLPRLELCGAHLLVKLMSKIRTNLGIEDITMHGWTDSTIVLSWIADHPRRWKTFVANRTSQIIEVLPASNWSHIKSSENPADLATRGISIGELAGNYLWWHGPPQLHQSVSTTENHNKFIPKHTLEERQEKVTINIATTNECSFIEKYSSLSHLIRITALILRFTFNCKNKTFKRTGFITTDELITAHDILVKTSQHASFSNEIKSLTGNKPLPSNHAFSTISPFIDNKGLLRVGGRLSNAEINFDQKHPIILDKRHHFTHILIRHYHIAHCHAGNRLLQYLIQLKYWIPSGSHLIKSIIYKCSTCMRQKAKPYNQQMGQLPAHRVVPAPVFSKIGIDFAGPLQVRAWKGRGGKTYKCWVAIFVCLVTKAVHIELVTELSTAAFIASLRRFVSRRGKPSHIYSDNGTNFIGAKNHLKDLYEFLRNNTNKESIDKYLTDQHITWHLIPPKGPNFGGLWEAGVKAIKFHLNRVLKEASPTFEELHTVLCQIEACLNSRPLCIKYEGDIDALTPAHFIILRSMHALPYENCEGARTNCLSRWQYIQRLVGEFWKKWSLEYLNQLQQKYKWKQARQDIKINDIVVIKEDNSPPLQWLMGRVCKIHPGDDGLIRVVTLQTKNGNIKRPVSKLCPLYKDC